MPWTTLLILTVIFVATLIRTTLGFGEALIAVPLLAFVVPVEVAAPLAVLVSITVAALVLARDWRHVELRSAIRLVLATIAGIPIGLLILRRVPAPLVKAGLGLVVCAFSLWMVRGQGTRRLTTDRRAWLFGAAAGVLGGAYGMNGPPLVMYGMLRRWSRDQFRVTLQGYFLPASVIGMAGYWMTGLWTPRVSRYYLESLPAALVAIGVGHALHARADSRRFFLAVHIGLVASGVGLLIQAIAAWARSGIAF